MESPLDEELSDLKARATRLEQNINNETDRDVKLARLAELPALHNRIAELQKKENILLEQSRGNFLFLRGEFCFLLEFVYFLWP
jgi:hypothetical protein